MAEFSIQQQWFYSGQLNVFTGGHRHWLRHWERFNGNSACDGLWKKVDHLALELTHVGCFADVVQLLMATFFAFNVQYPYRLGPTYDLLETPLKIRKHPRTTVARELLRILES